jgi:transcriptional regulator with XRE-family HTH domain
MTLLTREEFYKRIGQALRSAPEKRGLSREELAERLNQTSIDPERCLRRIAALSVMAGSIRKQKGLTRKQVAERANLSVEFVRDMEAGKIFNPEIYLVYCLSYGLRMPYSKFEKRVDRLSRIELDENDMPIRRRKKRAELPKPTPRRLLGSGNSEKESAAQRKQERGTSGMGGSDDEPPNGTDGL